MIKDEAPFLVNASVRSQQRCFIAWDRRTWREGGTSSSKTLFETHSLLLLLHQATHPTISRDIDLLTGPVAMVDHITAKIRTSVPETRRPATTLEVSRDRSVRMPPRPSSGAQLAFESSQNSTVMIKVERMREILVNSRPWLGLALTCALVVANSLLLVIFDCFISLSLAIA